MRGSRKALAVVLLLGLASACGDDSSDSAGPAASGSGTASSGSGAVTTTTAPPEVCTADKVGGAATFGAFSEPRSLDPLVAGGGSTGSNELAALYDVLVRYEPTSGTFVPWLAQSIEANADSSTWTLKLRPDVKFSNGDALTAAAVKSSIERHQSVEGRSQQRSLVLNIATITVVDPLTVTFALKGPWPGFPYVLGGPAGMVVNPNVVKTLDSTGFPKDGAGIGAGPYKLTRWATGESMTMQARTDYWGGPVCISELKFVTLGGGAQAYESLKGSTSDITFLRTPEVIAQARTDKTALFSTLGGAGEILLLNSGVKGAKPPTADVRVRQAIAMAIDPKVVDDRANAGKGFVTSALVPKESRFFQGIAGPATDAAKAKALLTQVMGETGWDGTLRFQCDNAPARQAEALAVKTMLEAVGFKVNLDNAQSINGMITKVVVDANFDIACFGFNVTDQSPWAKLDRLLGTGSASNYAGYANPQFDAALVKLRTAATEQATKDALKEIQTIWTDTMPAAILAASEEVVAWKPKVHGLTPTMESVVLFGDAYVK